MNKKKLELRVVNISNSLIQTGAYALVLGEVGGERQLSVIIGPYEAQMIIMEFKGVIPPRPLTHNLFASVLEVLNVELMRVLIHKVDNGIFYSYLYMKAGETILQIDSRTSDAIALALRMDAPIFTYEEVFESKESNAEEEINNLDQKTLPTGDVLSDLKAALQKAIENEEYERAAAIRDQINQQSKL